MRTICYALLYGTLALTASNMRAQDQDAEGCKDSAIITRMPGSTIHSCKNKEYEQATLTVAKDKDGNETEKKVEGEFHS